MRGKGGEAWRRRRPHAAALVQYLSLSRAGTVRYSRETCGVSRGCDPAVVAYVVCMYRIRARLFATVNIRISSSQASVLANTQAKQSRASKHGKATYRVMREKNATPHAAVSRPYLCATAASCHATDRREPKDKAGRRRERGRRHAGRRKDRTPRRCRGQELS